jgi:hypothetical protein
MTMTLHVGRFLGALDQDGRQISRMSRAGAFNATPAADISNGEWHHWWG